MPASPLPLPTTVSAVLDAVALAAQQSLPSAVSVSLTLVRDGIPSTAASSSDWAAALDRAQYDAGSGPCVDAAIGGETCVMSDASSETRWPAYVDAALLRGVGSSMSVPIPVDDDGVVGSLNAFATGTQGFAPASQVALARLAGIAAAALMTADIDGFGGRSRAVVDQAKGIVMTTERCSAAQAMDILGRRAGDSGRSLIFVAEALVRETSAS